jgi:hypothetical protein
MNSARIFTHSFLKVCFNISPSASKSSKFSVIVRFSGYNLVRIFHFSTGCCYMLRPFHLPSCGYFNNICENYELWSLLSCCCLHITFTSSFLGPNNHARTLFSDTVDLFLELDKEATFHTHAKNTWSQNFISFLTFVHLRREDKNFEIEWLEALSEFNLFLVNFRIWLWLVTFVLFALYYEMFVRCLFHLMLIQGWS